jgi:hypothetical protein
MLQESSSATSKKLQSTQYIANNSKEEVHYHSENNICFSLWML